jgi:hypothetical protein
VTRTEQATSRSPLMRVRGAEFTRLGVLARGTNALVCGQWQSTRNLSVSCLVEPADGRSGSQPASRFSLSARSRHTTRTTGRRRVPRRLWSHRPRRPLAPRSSISAVTWVPHLGETHSTPWVRPMPAMSPAPTALGRECAPKLGPALTRTGRPLWCRSFLMGHGAKTPRNERVKVTTGAQPTPADRDFARRPQGFVLPTRV